MTDGHVPATAPARGPRELIFEMSVPGAACVLPPSLDVPEVDLDAAFAGRRRGSAARLPELSEGQIARHYQHLASMNFGVDSGPYPLGSCTMKHNPRVNEDTSRLAGFAGLHPLQPEEDVQGALELMVELSEMLSTIAGLPHCTLQPAAGAHGELTALMCFKAYHESRGDHARTKVVIPDSAHGTNPATVAMCGWDVVTIASDEYGQVDLDSLKGALGPDVAAFMLTNPNTLGLFDANTVEITRLVHEAGALAYCDGANLNAIMGWGRPGDMGFDAMHINLHKTFSTPHGGGGPGAGPVCVSERLAEFLPGPLPCRLEDGFGWFVPEASIGRVRSGWGNFGVIVRAYTYLKGIGAAGVRDAAADAVLAANYLRVRLAEAYDVAFDRTCMHEFVITGARRKRETGVRTLDVAKRLLDYGIHPPTVYFPLIVEEALMVEPTETDSLADLDRFVDAMVAIAAEADTDPELVMGAPYTTPVRRMDEASAARAPRLRWTPED